MWSDPPTHTGYWKEDILVLVHIILPTCMAILQRDRRYQIKFLHTLSISPTQEDWSIPLTLTNTTTYQLAAKTTHGQSDIIYSDADIFFYLCLCSCTYIILTKSASAPIVAGYWSWQLSHGFVSWILYLHFYSIFTDSLIS